MKMALTVTPADVLIEFEKGGMGELGQTVAEWMFAWADRRRDDLFIDLQVTAGIPIQNAKHININDTEGSLSELIEMIKTLENK